MKKKNLKILLIVLFILNIIVFCTDKNKDYKENSHNETKKVSTEEFKKEPDVDELKFYDDIEDAVLASDFEEYMKAENVKNVIRTIEEDDNCLVFFSGEKEGNDYIYVYKIKKKQSDKKIQYLQPMFGIAWEWKEKCIVIKKIRDTYKPSEWIEQMVRLDLNLINSSGAFNIDKDDKAFKCGFLSDKNIYRLKIDGEKPTEIIETTLDGDKVYFWYYEGIEMNPNDSSTLSLSFK